jgi:sulfite dehydrogenase (quinone) subunit SoeC
MNPAWSVIFFTTLCGAAQGLVVTIAVTLLAGLPLPADYVAPALAVAIAMGVAGLAASFAHLGHPERAWRAMMMWRTSWLSREVIVLPVFIAVVTLWWWAITDDKSLRSGWAGSVLPLAAIVMAALLWWCTAMIYACLRFIQEWAHPLTLVNYTLIGLSNGSVLACSLAMLRDAPEIARAFVMPALALTGLAWLTRMVSLARNASLKPLSSLQSATGIRSETIVQRAMGMSAGSFNTREFFHGAKQAALKQVRAAFVLLAFALPSLLLAWAMVAGSGTALLLAFPLQYAGVLAERWFFFAQARHPQNLYYQTVS